MKQSPPGTAEPQLRIDAPNTQDAPNKEALARENTERGAVVKAELGLRGPREEFDSEKSSEKIIRLILENPSIAAQSIANQLGLTSRAIEKHLSTLKAKGRIRRVGPDKGGRWEVLP